MPRAFQKAPLPLRAFLGSSSLRMVAHLKAAQQLDLVEALIEKVLAVLDDLDAHLRMYAQRLARHEP